MNSSATLSILLFCFIFTSSICSQTIIPSTFDYPTDVWTKENSPYIIEGPLGLASTSTLIIQPGVVIKFMEGANISAYNNEKLFALGTEEEKIIFTSAKENPSPGDWSSIFISDSDDNVKLIHCIIEYAQTGIRINSELRVSSFAMECPDENSFPEIDNCVVRFCEIDGIRSEAETSENGICIVSPIPDASPIITNCEIYGNGNHGINLIAGPRGRVSSTITHNLIYDNQGDGISTDVSSSGFINPKIKNNTIVDNRIIGIQFNNLDEGTAFEISSNIITGSSFGLFTAGGASPIGGYNNIWNNLINYQGLDPIEGDISEDPLFLDAEQNDFRLTLGSPSIDAGNPNCPVDPDSTIADMGAFYFDQTFFSDFGANDMVGTVSFEVQFSEMAILGNDQVIDKWHWDFGDGSTSEERNPRHVYTQKGKFNVSLTISNATFLHTETKTAFICILNSPPQVMSLPGAISFDEDAIDTSLNLSAVFTDPDGDFLTYTTSESDHLTFQIDDNGQVKITPESNWNGNEEVTFLVQDDEEASNSLVLKIVVKPVNDPPTIESIFPENTMMDTTNVEIEFSVMAQDVDNALEYNWSVNGEGVLGTSNQYSRTFNESGTFEVVCEITDGIISIDTSWTVIIGINKVENLPEEIEEINVYPNPSDHFVDIDLQLKRSSFFSIEIWNMTGERITEIFKGQLNLGQQKIRWLGLDEVGRTVPAGIYFIKYKMDNNVFFTHKIIRL